MAFTGFGPGAVAFYEELATDNSPNACWDDARARAVLRRETTPAELRELGMEQKMIDFVFDEPHA